MKIGLQISRFNWPGGTPAIGPTLARIARSADDAGFDSLWVMDHFFQIRGLGPAEDPMLEAGRRWDSWRRTRAGRGWGSWWAASITGFPASG